MKPTIAIFIHDPHCETECALAMIEGLVSDFNVRTFGLDELNYEFLMPFDAVAFPGGMGDAADFYEIFNNGHIRTIKSYLRDGGKYFGICMGAYWAGPDYFNIVGDMSVEQYIERPNNEIGHEGPTVADITWLGQPDVMYFYDGCAMTGDSMEVVATYANGDAMAVIKNGVGIIGCHPESQQWWFELDMIPHYLYNTKHKQLMSDFVKRLVNNE